MQTRNKFLLRRPWAYPIITAFGSLVGIFLSTPDGLGVAANVAIVTGCNAVLDCWFFWLLRRGQRIQAVSTQAVQKSE